MARLESEVGRLYEAYAGRFASHALFWRKLSNEEADHARLIRSLADRARLGEIIVDGSRFRKEAVEMVLNSLDRHIRDAESGKTDVVAAFSIASTLETSLLEKEFFRIFQGDTVEIRGLLDRLQKDTQNHRILIQSLWHSVRDGSGGS